MIATCPQPIFVFNVPMPRKSKQFTQIADEIWNLKYRLKAPDGAALDETRDDTFWRVARAAASVESGGAQSRYRWAHRFYEAISDFGFLPAGRILAGAGADRNVTLFNCFVMGPVPDDLGGIFKSVKQGALTLQSGGGIGVDFSTLRPRGALVKSIGADASGPVSFMDVWDAMCRSIMSAGARRGAMMATLRADHPDIETFIDAKSEPGRLTNFNLSVLVSDAFMTAVKDDTDWHLQFDGQIYRTVRARTLWDKIMRATYDYAEPGVIFIDRVNERNNLGYCEKIAATNPCGEQPLPPNGACLLGSVNLAKLVTNPFAAGAGVDTALLEERVAVAVRLLDNLIDVSRYPLKAQRKEALAKRRMGLGLTGLADALIMSGIGYESHEGRQLAGSWMATIAHAAYRASAALAAEKGVFPLYDRKAYLASPNLERLPKEVRQEIARHGIRNGCLTSIAPTGTISLFAGNVSSGVEPVFDFTYQRRILGADRQPHQQTVEDYAYRVFRDLNGPDAVLPEAFVRAQDLSPGAHLKMQAAVQAHVDSSISKTINCPQDLSFEAFSDVYRQAYELGLKGCTTYRPNAITGAVLQQTQATGEASGANAALIADQPDRATAGAARTADSEIVYMAQPLQREGALQGVTYKLKWPESKDAIYVTINDIEENGRRRPFEIFINTRNLEHYAWTVALTRMISAVFRRGGDVSFVADELKGIFDPQGGRWINGRYVPSLLAAIGDIVETHMRRTGFLPPGEENISEFNPAAQDTQAGSGRTLAVRSTIPNALTRGRFCPKCSSPHYEKREACWECRSCGFSRCD